MGNPRVSYRDILEVWTNKELEEYLILIYEDACDILEGCYPFKNDPWRGHGTALCIYGMVCCSFIPESDVSKEMMKFFISAQYMMAALGERIEKPDLLDPKCTGKSRMKTVAKVRQRVMNNLTCAGGCGGRKGFANLGDRDNQWWVCSQCGNPTEQWLRAQGDDVLNMFRGGPVDGYVYSTTMLLSVAGLQIPVTQYVWTAETVRSPTTGRVARVWQFQPGARPGNVVTGRNTSTQLAPTNGVKRMSQETVESPVQPENAIPVPTPEPAPAPVVVEPVDVSDLLPTRTALNASRTVVAKEADITVAQLYRIENGGKRTTAAEAANVRAALGRLKAFHAEQARIAAEAQAAAAPVADGVAPDPS